MIHFYTVTAVIKIFTIEVIARELFVKFKTTQGLLPRP